MSMNEKFVFQEGVREQLKARLGFVGPAGSGKTYSALVFASTLGKNIFVIDTEDRSALYYADEFTFKHLPLGPPYSPARYIAAMQAAIDQGADVILLDSLTHAWADEGGVLDMKDKIAARSRSGNSFDAWREATPEHNKLVNFLVRCPVHLLATMRSKTAYVMEEYTDRNGQTKTKPVKIGMEPIQRQGMDYEFTLVADLDTENTIMVTKSRCKPLARAVVRNPDKDPTNTQEMAKRFAAWLDEGVAPSRFVNHPWMDALVDMHGEGNVLTAVNEIRASRGAAPINDLMQAVGAPPEIQQAIFQHLERNGQDDQDWGEQGSEDAEGSTPSTTGGAVSEPTGTESTASGGPAPATPSSAEGASTRKGEGVSEPKAEAFATPPAQISEGEGPPASSAEAVTTQSPSEGESQGGDAPVPTSSAPDVPALDRCELMAKIDAAVTAKLRVGRSNLTEGRVTSIASGERMKMDPASKPFVDYEDFYANADAELLAALVGIWRLDELLEGVA